MSLISLLKQDDDTDQEISDEENEDYGVSTLHSNIKDNHFDQQHEDLLPGQACRDKSLGTPKVPLPKKRTCADTVIACLLLPNSPISAVSIAPRLLNNQQSTFLNKRSESDHVPSSQALPLRKSGGDHNVPQPKPSAEQILPQHQKATCEMAKMLQWATFAGYPAAVRVTTWTGILVLIQNCQGT